MHWKEVSSGGHSTQTVDPEASVAVELACLHLGSQSGTAASSTSGPLQLAVKQFTDRWGLLGILPHIWWFQQYHLAGGGTIQAHRPGVTTLVGNEELDRRLKSHYSPDENSPDLVLSTPSGETLILEAKLGNPVAAAPATAGEEGAWIYYRSLISGRMEVAPLEELYDQFFPTRRGTGVYPKWGGAEFWADYAEPLSWFVHEVIQFQETWDLAALVAVNQASAEMAQDLTDRLGRELEQVRVDPIVAPDGGIQESRCFPSLLAVAYYQLFHYAIHGGLARRCGNPPCSKRFLSNSRLKEYCSASCASAVRMRTKRRRDALRGT